MSIVPVYAWRSWLYSLATAAIGFMSPFAGAQEKPPSAQQVLDRFVEATGGKPSYQKLQNQVITGSIEFVEAGYKGTTTEFRALPNKVYRVVELTGAGKMEAGTDGLVAWERSSETGPRVKTGEEGTTALREASFNAALRWREIYDKVELTGEESVDDQPCYKVALIPKEGKPITQCYDKKTGLLVKVAMTILTPNLGEVASEAFLSDYRPVDGVQVPHLVKRRVLSQQIVTRIESVRFNTEIAPDRFYLPADVRALTVKKQASEGFLNQPAARHFP
jgi:hypothetical protein